jgi:L-aminopeptidase/D-esterase-like protein
VAFDLLGLWPMIRTAISIVCALCGLAVSPTWAASARPRRARDFGIPFQGKPGRNNAITDVKGVQVGHTTKISSRGKHAVRTGVTVIHPLGKDTPSWVPAGFSRVNGNGEVLGAQSIIELGGVGGAIGLSNTYDVGVVGSAIRNWELRRFGSHYEEQFSLPVAIETYDGFLNDIRGGHLQPRDVSSALSRARSGPVQEGSVGGGTGMKLFEYKGGIGTSSRVVKLGSRRVTVGVLVQANFGLRKDLRMAGIPVGETLTDHMPEEGGARKKDGSIAIVIATDAPLDQRQLTRLASRAAQGLGRTGSVARDSSGDFAVAFSTRLPTMSKSGMTERATSIRNEHVSPLFEAVAQGVEEAVANALVAGRTMTGVNGNKVYGINVPEMLRAMQEYKLVIERQSQASAGRGAAPSSSSPSGY